MIAKMIAKFYQQNINSQVNSAADTDINPHASDTKPYDHLVQYEQVQLESLEIRKMITKEKQRERERENKKCTCLVQPGVSSAG